MSFQIRPLTTADYEHYVALLNSQISEPISLDEMHREDQLRDPQYPYLRLASVDEGGNLLGFGIASQGASSRPGQFWTRVRVWKHHEGKGIGRELYSRLVAFMKEHGGTSAESGIKDDDPRSQAWAERRGFQVKHHLFESILSLPDWDPSPFLEAVHKAEAAGFSFATLAEEGDVDSLLPRFYEFSVALVHDIPGMEDRPRFPYDQWLKHVKADPDWDPKLILLALQGDRWVGMAQISKTHAGGYYHNFTGINREVRGHGLSLAVKVVTLLKAKELGAPYLRTNNHSVNKAMLATNQRLGYKPLPGFYQLVADL